MKKPLEKAIEAAIGEHARKRGCLWYKFTSPARPSVPDRILIGPTGKIVFLELKRQGEKPTTKQLAEILRLQEHGVDARWTDNVQEGKEIVNEVCA